jgi:hypothetical protein
MVKMGSKLSLDLKNRKLNFLTGKGGWRIVATNYNSVLLLQFFIFLHRMENTSSTRSTLPFLFLD